jgi:hypothetical protein
MDGFPRPYGREFASELTMSNDQDIGPDAEPKHVDVDEYSESPPSDNPSGAVIVTVYAKRRVSAYPILESEIATLSTFNTLSAICFSFMSAFISFAFGIWVNALFVENPPAEGRILSHIAAPACCLIAVAAAGLGLWAVTSRRNSSEAIRRESSGQG